MKIEIDLTERQWSELYHAVETKQLRVEEGAYGDGPEEERWAEELEGIKNVVGASLDEKGVVY